MSPEVRQIAEDLGCEEGKKYYDDAGDLLEVPQCPFCGVVVWNESRCKHLVFIFDATNGVYEEIDGSFKDLCINDEGELEAAECLKIKGLQLYEIHDQDGIMGRIWGFTNKHYTIGERGLRTMTNHDMIVSALRNHRGQTLSTGEIKKIVMRAYPMFSEGSLLPNDHAEGNKNPCWCAGTDRRIFDKVRNGVYRVL